tara:strand:- start:156 stop:500 length:345 start_codon:yes stop_codon:yes gene_type:complete
MKFTGTIKDGVLNLHDKKGFENYLNNTEGDVWVDVKPSPKARSSQQNNYYRLIVKQIGDHLGYNPDEMHDIIKQKFEIASTKDLSVEDFSEILDRIIRFAATLGFVVEDPRRTT